MSLPERPRVAVVGATGAVGRVMLKLLAERKVPAAEVRAVATARSAGTELDFGDAALTVQAGESALEGIDLVLLDTPDEAARELAPKAVEAGAVVVDNSAAWRMEDSVPLVVPEINPEAARDHRGIIASPNCTTIGVIVPLHPLHEAFGLKSFRVSSYQATSGAGRAGVQELREQVTKVSDDLELLAEGDYRGPEPAMLIDPIAFNVVPQIGSLGDGGFTGEEIKLLRESRKIMGLPDLEVSATCVRVPAVVGHGAAIHARFEKEVTMEGAVESLRAAAGVEVTDHPTPLRAAGGDPVLVGRVRRDPFDSHALWLFSASDNLRKGAALNTVQVAELLLS